ncbi:hypothetical protein LCGC14_1855040 [marine sediment metagenome]|uniref:DNA-directed DNA polymerase n=1 Tax=marine sediment metagenome TaxID=412755 RepID=A0A0F9J8F3_9ZZZZ
MSSIDRKPHCLKREKSLAMPRSMLFFDTETRTIEAQNGGKTQILKLGVSCYYRRKYGRHTEKTSWIDYRDTDTFWNHLFSCCERKHKLWCIARNLTFDFTVLKGWKYLRENGYKLKFFHSKGTTTIVSVRGNGHSILFVDSLNWFRESLASTGKRIGLPKLKIDFETCSDSYLLTYCHRDVEIELENFKEFIRFLDSNTISRLCYTLGSTAMAAFLLNHYSKKIYIHNNEQAIRLERASYKGGRVECFYIGDKKDENHYVLDVNSLYPSVMYQYLYPSRYIQILQKISPDSLREHIVDKAAIAKVMIDTGEPAYAIRRERTIFPVGRFWTTLTTPELQYGFDRGHIVEVDTCVLYEQTDIFSSYVKCIYDLRMKCKSDGLGSFDVFCKYLLNSLYGKFGQKAEQWNKIGVCPDEPDRVELLFVEGEKRTRQIRYLLGEIFELVGYEECFNSFPAIASHVTAYGRLRLWDLIKKAGRQNVYYCDTDSVIVNKAGLFQLQLEIDETSLGKLKLEETTSELSIRGLKDYTTDGKNVIKGIRKTAIEIQPGCYTQEKWPTFRGTLRSGDANSYTVETITKHLHRGYTKGHVTETGLVVPFVLDE